MTEEKQRYLDTLVRMKNTFLAKNHDYGCSAHNTFLMYGPVSYLVRMHDKAERLRTMLFKGDGRVKEESIMDTVGDLAVYALMFSADLNPTPGKEHEADVLDAFRRAQEYNYETIPMLHYPHPDLNPYDYAFTTLCDIEGANKRKNMPYALDLCLDLACALIRYYCQENKELFRCS